MNRGFYTAASSIMLQQKKLNTLSNNLANINTAGFKPETLTTQTFDQVLSRVDKDGIFYSYSDVGTNAQLKIVDSIEQYFSQGDIVPTDRVFDVAIGGDGYFNILNDGDEKTSYTRNGSFNLDNEGYLNLEGYGRVQGQGGDIYLGTDQFIISEEGIITNEVGEEIDTLKISFCDDIVDMRKQHSGLYQYEGEGEMYDLNATVVHKSLEKATTNLNTEITNMMDINRQFQAMITVLKTIDTVNEKAANELGKL